MANLLTTLREAVAADLALEFPDADVIHGERSGRAVDRAKIGLFWMPLAEQQDKVVVGQARLNIRYWPASPKVRDDAPSGTRDPEPLEQAMWDLATLLQTKQTSYSATGAWYVRLVGVDADYDPEEWGVEAVLLAVFDNPAVIG